MAVLLSTATITACAGNNTPETKKETVAKKESPVEIIYFHGKQRCMTCMAIEKETKALVEGELAEDILRRSFMEESGEYYRLWLQEE